MDQSQLVQSASQGRVVPLLEWNQEQYKWFKTDKQYQEKDFKHDLKAVSSDKT